MIGNDVVDLAAARLESNIRRKGWQEKLFTADECAFISASRNPEVAVWLLWSMKEAAYKAWNRQSGIRIFAPQKLQCTVDQLSHQKASGMVKIESNRYYTQSEISKSFIHTIAVRAENMFDDIRYIPEAAVAKDDNALPYFKKDCQRFPASKSHHGNHSFSIALFNI